jgi:hypothetical protein
VFLWPVRPSSKGISSGHQPWKPLESAASSVTKLLTANPILPTVSLILTKGLSTPTMRLFEWWQSLLYLAAAQPTMMVSILFQEEICEVQLCLRDGVRAFANMQIGVRLNMLYKFNVRQVLKDLTLTSPETWNKSIPIGMNGNFK